MQSQEALGSLARPWNKTAFQSHPPRGQADCACGPLPDPAAPEETAQLGKAVIFCGSSLQIPTPGAENLQS